MKVTTRRRLRRALLVSSSAVIVGGSLTTVGMLSPQRAAATDCPTLTGTSISYTTTGEHCFTVPAGLTTIHAVLIGGSGGAGVAGSGNLIPGGTAGLGGHGMQVSGDVAVTPGSQYFVYVGGNGTAGGDTNVNGVGGFNGGAHGGGQASNEDVFAGGGGGATDLRNAEGAAPTNCAGSTGNDVPGSASVFVLVAAGGGGGGNGSNGVNDSAPTKTVGIASPNGGNGGSQPGDANPPSAGTPGSIDGGGGGGAATNSANGTGGAAAAKGGGPGSDGGSRAESSGCGGPGGNPGDGQSSGGGGGGGYNGGGGGGGSCGPTFCFARVSGLSRAANVSPGGGGGGGGSGSDFHSSAVTNFAETIDAPGPSAVITYSLPTPTPTASVQPISVPATGGSAPTLDAGLWLLGIGAVLFGAVAVGRRRSPHGAPRPPA